MWATAASTRRDVVVYHVNLCTVHVYVYVSIIYIYIYTSPAKTHSRLNYLEYMCNTNMPVYSKYAHITHISYTIMHV